MYDSQTSAVAAFGPIVTSTLVNTSASIGTTAAEFAIASSGSYVRGSTIVIKIVNLSTTAFLAWDVTIDGSVPTLDTTIGSANFGSAIAPGQTEYFSVNSPARLFIAASAAATNVAVSSYSL